MRAEAAYRRPGAPVLAALSTLACPYEPPPDLDDEAGDATGSGTGEIVDDRVFDGQGMGVIRPPRIVDGEGLALNAVVIGTPSEDWETLARTGQISILVDDGEQGLVLPISCSRSTTARAAASSNCIATRCWRRPRRPASRAVA